VTYPTFGNDWRKRWVQLGGSNAFVLHRVASTVSPPPREGFDDLDEWEMDFLVPIGIQGTTACGRTSRLGMPGLFSRMGEKRCIRCCRLVGIPPGKGAPFNDKSLTPEQQEK
jgi:hypothetical protein